MPIEDIGYLIFSDFLGMTDYPGGVFSQYPNLFQQIIMFLIVPTIFIIMVLYIMTGRIIPDRKLRIMLGVGAYLFIVAGRYYSFFAYLSGPYFIFLIFILGVLGYIVGHFRVHDRGGGTYSRSYDRGSGGGYSREENLDSMSQVDLEEAEDRTQSLIRELEHQIKDVKNNPHEQTRLETLRSEVAHKKVYLEEIQDQMKRSKQYAKKFRRQTRF